MPGETNMKMWARTVMMLAGALLAASMLHTGPAGLALSTSKGGVGFELKTAVVTVAFDIGQECSKMNNCGRLV